MNTAGHLQTGSWSNSGFQSKYRSN